MRSGRTPQYLVRSLEDAEKHGYALGVKLVRGAYHHFETEAASSPDTCPVWNTKPETDSCFDDCAEILIAALKTSLSGKGSLGILFGTHNTESCDKILKQLLRNNLARYIEGRFVLNSCTADHCSIAQLYGNVCVKALVPRLYIFCRHVRCFNLFHGQQGPN